MKNPYIKKSEKMEALNRANNKCEDCGATQNLEVHHVKSWKYGGNHETNNLKVLCHDCHRKIKIANWQRQGSLKSIHETFTIEEYIKLTDKKEKSGLSWHDFIMQLATHTILPKGYHDVDKFYKE